MAEEIPEGITPEAKPQAQRSRSAAAMEDLYYNMNEETFTVSPYHPDSYQRPYNPDPLVKKDYTYGVYEEMLRDDQVNVAMQIKKDLVVGSGWYIDVLDESQGQIKKDLENLISDETDRPFSEILNDICQAYDYGFSVSEKIFKINSDNKLALKNLKPRHPASWLLHTDEQGNVIRYEQRGPNNSIDVDPNTIIHYINNDKHQNPYGRSDLYPAYQAFVTKRHVSRFYAIYLENAAGPKPVAKYDRRAPQSVVSDIFDIIKSFQTKTAMTIPKEFELEFLEAKTNGEAYIKGLNLFNMYIGRALFIPDLVGFQGSETGGGSFSLGQEQIGLFYKHIYRRRQVLERLIDQHIIRPLVIYNYGLQKDYPKFKFMPLSEGDALKQAEMWIKGVQGSGYKPTLDEVNHFRNLIKFPQSEEIEFKNDSMPQPNQPMDQEIEEPENEEDDSEEEMQKKQFRLALSTLPGEYKKRVDFKMADNLMKNSQMKILEELEPVVNDAFEDLYTQIEKSNVIKNQNIDKVSEISIRGKYLKEMQKVFKKHYRQLYYDSQIMAKSEIRRADNARKKNENIPADEFLSFLDKETYQYVGDWEYTITKRARADIVNAIKDGKPLSDVVGILDDEGKKLSDTSLERFSRTKSTEVFNRGRMEYFNSTGVIAAYQYAAILDDVTSEICGNLHGLTFPVGEAPVPPMHFNCRSVLVPITKYEDWSADRVTNSGKNVDKFLEENVSDKGFSVYTKEDKPKKPQITDPNVEIL